MLFPIASMADSLSSSDPGDRVGAVRDGSFGCRACETGMSSTDKHRFGIVSEALQQTGLRELACVRVNVSDREMTLDGEVATFYLKQLATEAVRPHASGLVIKNRLLVPQRERTR